VENDFVEYMSTKAKEIKSIVSRFRDQDLLQSKKYKIIGDKMVTLNIDNPAIENYFHQNADEMFRTLEAIALNKAYLVATNNTMPQIAI
jgi:hypothetical protein